MYPEEMIAPMRAELANSGYTETKTADEVKSAINAEEIGRASCRERV